MTEELPFEELVSSFENVASFLKTHPPEPVHDRLTKEREQLSEAVRSVVEVCNTGFSMKKVLETLKEPKLAKLLGQTNLIQESPPLIQRSPKSPSISPPPKKENDNVTK